MDNIIKIYQKRRSVYYLDSKILLPQKKVIDIIGESVKYAPSAFNSQSARVLVLLEKEHRHFWDITLEKLHETVSSKNFATTEAKIKSFAAGYGTILFFEDQDVIADFQKQYSLYQADFQGYALQSSGMLQYMIWAAFAAEQIGASLQHYNQIIEEKVQQTWKIPASWKLISQMPFGNIVKEADVKLIFPLEDRMKVVK